MKIGLDVNAQSFLKGQLAAEVVKKGLEKIVEVGREVVEKFEGVLEAGDQVKKTSQSIGIATDALQELQYAGQLVDLSAEDMSQSIGILSRKMQEAKEKGGEAAKAFRGIEFLKGGKLKATDEVLGQIADKFKSMPDGAEKTALAMELFGRSGKQMIPLLNEGSEALANTRNEARDLGYVLDGEAIAASEEFTHGLHRLKLVTEGLWRQAIAPLTPKLNELLQRFLAWRKANAEILKQKLQHYTEKFIEALELLGQVARGVYGGMQVALGELKQIFEAIGPIGRAVALEIAAAWIIAAAPFLAIGAAIGAILLLLNSIKRWREGKDSLFGDWMNMLDEWQKPNKDDPWWLAALKETVKFMREAVNLADRLGFKNDKVRVDPNTGQSYLGNRFGRKLLVQPETFNKDNYGYSDEELADPYSVGSRYVRAKKAGLGNIRAGWAAQDWFGQGKYAEYHGPAYTPMIPQSRFDNSGGRGDVHINNPDMSVNITQQPGEDSEALSRRVRQEVREELQSTWDAAYPAVAR